VALLWQREQCRCHPANRGARKRKAFNKEILSGAQSAGRRSYEWEIRILLSSLCIRNCIPPFTPAMPRRNSLRDSSPSSERWKGENCSPIPRLRYATSQPKLSHGFDLPVVNVVACLLLMQIERLAKVICEKGFPNEPANRYHRHRCDLYLSISPGVGER